LPSALIAYIHSFSGLTLFFFAFIVCGIAGALSASNRHFQHPLSPLLGYIFKLAITVIALLHVVKTIYLTVHHGPIEVEIVTGCLHTTAWMFAIMPITRAVNGRQPLHPVFIIFIIMATTFLALELTGLHASTWYFSDLSTNLDHTMQTVVFAARGSLVAALFLLSAQQVLWRWFSSAPSGYQRLSDGLGINSDDSSATVAMPTASKPVDSKTLTGSKRKVAGSVAQRSGSTFDDVAYRFKVIWPFLWPKGQRMLQLRVVVCVGLLGVGRVVNLYVPLTYKHVIDVLTPNDNSNRADDTTGAQVPFPVMAILFYVGLRFLSGGGAGGMGLLNNFRSYLWIAVTQYTSRISRMDVFRHLHALSLRWHLSRKTGEGQFFSRTRHADNSDNSVAYSPAYGG
jgi:ATP-binding cassette subfamily B (MDR/TAP) protein 6